MDREEAKRKYLAGDESLVEQDYRELIEAVEENCAYLGIPNSDYSHTLYLTDKMFNKSLYEIRILTGDCCEELVGVLKEILKKALGRIKKTGGFLRAIVLADEIPLTLKALQEEYGDEVVQVTTAKAKDKVKHFIACDSRMLRAEDFHDSLIGTSDSGEIHADVYFDNPSKTKNAEQFFDIVWDKLAK